MCNGTFTTFLTLDAQMDSSFWFDTVNFKWSVVYMKGQRL